MLAAARENGGSRLYKDKWPRAGGTTGTGHAATGKHAYNSNEIVKPKHVRHCSGTGSRDWAIYTWDPLNPALVTRSPYMCNSWRCPVCQRHEAAIVFARTRAAFEGIEDYDPTRVGFFVLTLDRDGYYSGMPWADEKAAYAALSAMARKFLKRLRRMAARDDLDWDGRKWVATVEAHKSGWPHYQLMIYLPEEWRDELPTERGYKLGWSDLTEELRFHACAAGWGKRSSFERARDAGAVTGYLIGTAGKHEDSVARVRGELHKLSQLPTNAPARFRRVRSAKGFLPPRFEGSKTGTLIRRRRCDDGTFQAESLHELHSVQAREVSTQCCYHEEAVWAAERGFGALLRPDLLALYPELKAELLPRLQSFALPRPRGPPIPAPERPVGARQPVQLSWATLGVRTQMAVPYVAGSSKTAG